MTYTMRPVSPIKVDIILAKPVGGGLPQAQNLDGQCDFTRATKSGNKITIYSGSHWRIEYSGGSHSAKGNNFVKYQIYSVTDGDYIGLEGIGHGESYSTKAKCCATALILNSEISTSKEIEFRVVDASSTTARTSSAYASFQYMPIKIFELPVI